MVEHDLEPTVAFLSGRARLSEVGDENGWHRYAVGTCLTSGHTPPGNTSTSMLRRIYRGAWGTGFVHHLAWRMADEAHRTEVRDQVLRNGAHPTPVIDRFWFKSVYFREPGGVLFELRPTALVSVSMKKWRRSVRHSSSRPGSRRTVPQSPPSFQN